MRARRAGRMTPCMRTWRAQLGGQGAGGLLSRLSEAPRAARVAGVCVHGEMARPLRAPRHEIHSCSTMVTHRFHSPPHRAAAWWRSHQAARG
jgi:hypothetical protein